MKCSVLNRLITSVKKKADQINLKKQTTVHNEHLWKTRSPFECNNIAILAINVTLKPKSTKDKLVLESTAYFDYPCKTENVEIKDMEGKLRETFEKKPRN